ncbi:MAG: hypothetical protein JRJ26_12250 [Deltaproteobacteria bacterium]|nr:hypothetical protein [Deltaproteobacteria bacterium]
MKPALAHTLKFPPIISLVKNRPTHHNGDDRIYLYTAIVLLFLYLSPKILFGENSHVIIHDNLDWIVAPYKLLGEKYARLDFKLEIESFMMGTSRFPMQSVLNPIIWLYAFFKPFVAYVLNEIIIRVFALFGMYILLRKHIIHDRNSDLIAAGVSFCFSILPYYPLFGLTIAGQPSLVHAFWNIRDGRDKALDCITIVIFAFYSSLVFSGVFILFGLTIVLLLDWFSKRNFNRQFFAGILLLFLLYVISEYGIISTFLDSSFISHRSLRDGTWGSKTFFQSAVQILGNAVNGHYNAASLHKWILFLAVPLAFVTSGTMKSNTRPLFVLLTISFMISGFFGLWFWRGLVPVKNSIPILKIYGFYRFIFLHPLLWYLIFALCLVSMSGLDGIYSHLGRNLIYFLIIFQAIFIISHNRELVLDMKSAYLLVRGKKDNSITYRKFFSEGLFRDVMDYIDEPPDEYRVICVGLHPAVAQYNGFYTLDGYSSYYSAEYHERFRRLIVQELKRNGIWKKYYDNRGSRCYVTSWEFSHPFNLHDYTKYKNRSIKDLNLNYDVFRKLGGRYILSCVKIVNLKRNPIRLLKTFESWESPWRIFLYRIM